MRPVNPGRDTDAESQLLMTLSVSSESGFDPDLSGTELETMMSAIRDTGLAATSASAAALVISDLSPDRKPLVSLTSVGPVDRALCDFCLQDQMVEEVDMRLDINRPYRTRLVSIFGSDYVFLALPFSGHTDKAKGVFAVALHASQGNVQTKADICSHLALCAETYCATYDGMSGLATEVVSLANRAAHYQRVAETDPLTQLENPASFEEKVGFRLAQDLPHAAFIVVDIDHFKTINDLYGHQFGDQYLRTVGRALRASFPESSLVGRLGGDEFGIFTPIPSGGKSYLESLLARCRASIQRATATLKKPDLGRVSIGASQYPEHGQSVDQLYEHADAALYSAKESGRGATAIFQSSRHQRYNSADLSKRFHEAIANGCIQPFFQPVVDLQDGRCTGFEILARWRNQDGQSLEPAEFSAIFKDHSLAELMTRTILRAAFQDYARAVAPTGLPLQLALNVTFFDLMNPEFAFELQHAVSEYDFDWSLLTIEVTEQTMLGEPNGQVFRSLKELRARGANIALDDFGTGYGGLRHISNWPIDTLKIDKFFVDGLAGNNRDKAVLEAIMGMCRRLDLNVVAEGIETSQQIEALRNFGGVRAQGFAFERPLSGQELHGFKRVYDLSQAGQGFPPAP
jgi:diguanylate cyclase (GGDEF)-like protein